jgi:hypothetical protein
MSTKATRAAKTVARYRSLLDTVVLPRGKDLPLREVQFDDLQVWSTSLSVEGSVRFASKGLSASRVRQAYQLVGAVLKFAVKAKHLSANPADGVELPRLPEAEQRYLTPGQLHRLALASGSQYRGRRGRGHGSGAYTAQRPRFLFVFCNIDYGSNRSLTGRHVHELGPKVPTPDAFITKPASSSIRTRIATPRNSDGRNRLQLPDCRPVATKP